MEGPRMEESRGHHRTLGPALRKSRLNFGASFCNREAGDGLPPNILTASLDRSDRAVLRRASVRRGIARAQGQAPTRPHRATFSPMRTSEITYHDGSTELRGFMAAPDAGAGLPVVLVFHAWRGHDEFVRDEARKLAGMGFVGFAVDMYGAGKLGTTNEECSALMTPFMQDRALLKRRLDAAFAAARTISARVSSPAVWPAVRGNPRRLAQRPLPSMMQATCVPCGVAGLVVVVNGSGMVGGAL